MMKMLKVNILIVLAFIGIMGLTSGICSAANWQWIDSNDHYGMYFDTQSVLVDKNDSGKIINVRFWLKTVELDGSYDCVMMDALSRYKVSLLEMDEYNADGTLIKSLHRDNPLVSNVVPGTMAEKMYKVVVRFAFDKYGNRNNKSVKTTGV